MSSSASVPDPLDELGPLGDVTILVRAELDRTTMSYAELQRLAVGSVIKLPSMAGEMISVHTGDVRLGAGEVLVVDGALTVRMSEIQGRSGVPDLVDAERARSANRSER